MTDRTGARRDNHIRLLTPRGMLMIRADLQDPKVAGTIVHTLAVAMPEARRIDANDGRELAWMAPDELLAFVPIEEVDEMVHQLQNTLADTHHLVVDVSSMRKEFEIVGAVRDILAKGTPSDVSPGGLKIREFRRSRLGQLAAAFWLTENESAHILCRRSETDFMQRWLHAAAFTQNAPQFYHC
ncbi:MAG: sarcosine oxidase subunit gamma [Rhodobacteraceae bacterium]|nr:sarcosine oxidase subunit gamma [Paracoccaceae bacterium]MCY4195349.1 sarcosine oxidase subunit gamma [Paracoccaceae bacterium]MCY4326628.1 sarcosine oxidase subunit gamma [Paracoccaceae bacterium]